MREFFKAALASLAVASAAWQACSAELKLECVPLFESASVYADFSDASPASCAVSFRKLPDGQWQDAYPLVKGHDKAQFRGSIVKLSEDSPYELRADLKDAAGAVLASASSKFQTWSSKPPVAKTVELEGGPLEIKGVRGAPDAWIKYVPKGGAAIDGGDKAESAVLVDDCAYLIFEGLKVVGGRKHGFNVKDSEYVRIVDCEISGWSRIGKQDFSRVKPGERDFGKFYDEVERRYINNDAAVFVNQSLGVVVERCYAHDPRGAANSWRFAHPEGPNAIFVRAKGQTVVRWNDFPGSDLHRWNDVIEGYGNGFADGGFRRDADIYGNFLAFGDDDGIELDGGQMNVRFFGNKVEGTLCGISTAPNILGPSYLFENLVVNLSDEDGKPGSVIKNGGGPEYSNGMTFLFNNSFWTKGHGNSGVGYANSPVFKGRSRNNVMVCEGRPLRVRPGCPDNDFDFDLLSRKAEAGSPEELASSGTEANGVFAKPSFKDAKAGDFSLLRSSRGAGEALYLPGFGGSDPSAKRDMGAIQPSETGMMPKRPLQAYCGVGQVSLACDLDAKAVDSAKVPFSLKSGAKGPLKFRVLKNEAYPFFEVSPASGALDAAKPVELEVSSVPAAIAAPKLCKGAFIVKFEDGFSFPVSVYVKASTKAKDLKVDAKAFAKRKAVELVKAEGSSSGEALFLDAGKDGLTEPGEAFAEATVEIPSGAKRYVFARTKPGAQPAWKHNAFFVSVDGGDPVAIPLSDRGSDDWRESPLCFGVSRKLQLEPGVHSIRLYPRESLLFDSLTLKCNPSLDAAD